MDYQKGVVDVLWTGGWDSTYHVLSLLRRGLTVQPHYIRDPRRPSVGHELRAMKRISEEVQYRLSGRLLPLSREDRVEHAQLPADLKESFEYVLREAFVGDQYLWLAAYARANIRGSIDLAIHKDDMAHRLLEPWLERVNGKSYTLVPEAPPHIRNIFSQFSFPVLETTKVEMLSEAKAAELEDLLELTWFCYRPSRKGSPCGVCNPCVYTIEEGLAHRVTRYGYLRYCLRVYPRLKRALARYPKLYRRVQTFKDYFASLS